ncbi:aminopeptidase [Betaproteobacteria bacterium]|nr:aminopeptidase [Betaproteobacteria bacterium]GHU10271.1 aminopeptidase [Betaproteobacteria bacterium]GHU41835.1 aminopeptidase [Betaproteobacteria bacterium]
MEALDKWFLSILKTKYADFEGRAGREEFWMYTLFVILVFIPLSIVAAIAFAISNILGILLFGVLVLAAIGLFVPSLAISVRRLHDTGRSGWWYLICVIPIVNWVGSIVLLVFYCLDSQPDENQYGPNPKGQ